MKITVIGTGYVGLVTGACIADLGNDVICVDKNEDKINLLKAGKIPIYEPGLEELVNKNVRFNRLSFSTDLVSALRHTDVYFIAVGTPPLESGEADIRHVLEVTRTIGETLLSESSTPNTFKVIVNKSTVPVGMGVRVEQTLQEMGLPASRFGVVSNPEFLREGSAVSDSLRPNRIVLGSNSERALEVMSSLYRPLYLLETPIIKTNLETSELIKYASNCFLATKISFINEMANICELVGADVSMVAKGMGLDNRIGKYFLHAGPGYGGSCFPKDTKALVSIADRLGYNLKVVKAAEDVNMAMKQKAATIVKNYFGETLKGRTISVLGLAFKPNTDDMREASSVVFIEEMLQSGVRVKVFDPAAMEESKRYYLGNRVEYCSGISEALVDSDGLVIMTEWNEFRELDLGLVLQRLKTPFFLDTRNIYIPAKMKQHGFDYFSIGRN